MRGPVEGVVHGRRDLRMVKRGGSRGGVRSGEREETC